MCTMVKRPKSFTIYISPHTGYNFLHTYPQVLTHSSTPRVPGRYYILKTEKEKMREHFKSGITVRQASIDVHV